MYLVAIAAGFALSYLLMAFVVFPANIIPRDVKVPNVTGLMFDEAEQRLEQAGFKAERGEQRYNSSAPKNTVMEQSPAPGAREGLGNVITLIVSGGQRMATVPTIAGLSRNEAQSTLEKAGFDVGDFVEQTSNQPRGSVISTRPGAGTQVSIPTTITVVLSGGEASIQMPSLVGRDVDAARQTLNQLGIRDVKIVWDPMAMGARGTIVGQTPVAGATLLAGGFVQLRVAGDGAAP